MTMLFRLTAYSADEKILEILRSEPRFACDSAHSCGSGFPSKDKGQSRKRLSLPPHPLVDNVGALQPCEMISG